MSLVGLPANLDRIPSLTSLRSCPSKTQALLKSFHLHLKYASSFLASSVRSYCLLGFPCLSRSVSRAVVRAYQVSLNAYTYRSYARFVHLSLLFMICMYLCMLLGLSPQTLYCALSSSILISCVPEASKGFSQERIIITRDAADVLFGVPIDG